MPTFERSRAKVLVDSRPQGEIRHVSWVEHEQRYLQYSFTSRCRATAAYSCTVTRGADHVGILAVTYRGGNGPQKTPKLETQRASPIRTRRHLNVCTDECTVVEK